MTDLAPTSRGDVFVLSLSARSFYPIFFFLGMKFIIPHQHFAPKWSLSHPSISPPPPSVCCCFDSSRAISLVLDLVPIFFHEYATQQTRLGTVRSFFLVSYSISIVLLLLDRLQASFKRLSRFPIDLTFPHDIDEQLLSLL